MKKISLLIFIVMISYSGTLLAQNVGIGTQTPVKGKLVVQGTAGAVSAMFGDTTSGVSIENNWPGIGLNSYFNGSRKSITHGFGGLVGMNPDNGNLHIMSSTDSVGVNTNMGLYYRMLINKTGNIGIQGNTDPLTPLSFSNATGNKILLRGNSDTEHYGLGSQSGLMQLYVPNTGADMAFGHGSSIDFTENMRIKGSGIVGIGATDPSKGKLVVRGTVGAVSAIFGDTTSGISIENNYPGVGFNSYFNGGRKSITHGFGGLVGMDPNNGDFHIMSSTDSLGINDAMGLTYRLLINKAGNIGVQGNTNPVSPLSFANSIGDKISLFGSTPASQYGFGIQGALLQMYSGGAGTDIAFGYGSSTAFTENMRIKGNGMIGIGTSTPAYPLTLQEEGNGFVQKGTSVEIGTATTANAGIVKTYSNHQLQFATGANGVQMTLTYNGRVGIGTTLPSVKMEIAENGFDLLTLNNTQTLGSGKNVIMNFRTGSAFTGLIGTIGESATEARMAFGTGSFLIERLSIKANGNVGINNTNPSEKLEVNGNVNVNGKIYVNEISYSMAFRYTVFDAAIAASQKKVVMDEPALNGKSDLTVFVTRYDNAGADIPVRAIYDNALGKWCLYTNGYYQNGITNIAYTNCQDNCLTQTMQTFAECKFSEGQTFNILAFY